MDGQGTGIAGAELRLIVTDGRPAERGGFPFNWQMIQPGQLGSVAEVSQFASAVSDADGKFSFEKVRPGLDMEIAYWGDGVSQARLESIQQMTDEERENITIINVAPGIVRGTIDRNTLPKASEVTLAPKRAEDMSRFHSQYLSSDETQYEIRNVPPGSYELQVYGEPKRTSSEGFTRDVVQRHAVEVQSGETVVFDLGTASDQSGDRPEK